MKQKILVLVGPTSSGKSALAVELARKYNGEVISADSRQVYRGLDIGAGKITKREMRGIRHHLLDVASPKGTFTAHDFAVRGRGTIADIARRKKLPIIAGGTGFYIDAVLGRVVLPNVPIHKKLRAELEKKTAVQLFSLLKKRDPRRAKTIEPSNKRRLIRALEICATLGKNPENRSLRTPYHVLWIGISPTQKELEKKIAIRLSARMKQGMLSEARRLHAAGLSYRRMEAFGLEYRSLARLLQKKITRVEFDQELFRDIRRYAKRQMTYWKRNKEIVWLSPSEKRKVQRMVKNWLSGR